MPSERAEEPWVDAMDGPERLERAKKRRAEQMKRWERRESTTTDDVKRKRKGSRVLKFEPNLVILEAAARNDLDEVAQLLESGVSPDLANDDGLTALHQSCIDGCDDMVRYLVEHNANINAHDKESWTPLHAAAACGHMTIIRYLVENGGDVIALNLDGNLPVDVVEDNEKVEKYLDQQMLKLGYDEAAVEKLRLNQGKQLFDDLKDSVEKGRSLDIQDGMGATAFHVAAANGWTNIVEYLLENEADFEIRDNDGWQPIHAAAAWGHDTILEILAASGADLDSRTNDSQTPIDLTEEDEMIELIEELKTKEVKYPRKGKGVRRKRSNTNSSIKRSSIHEKNELSHADTKAERAALFIQLQNAEDSEANSPDETSSSPRKLEVIVGERASDSLRDETGSSGYVSEGSTDTKTDEKSQTNGKTDFFQAKTAHDETKNDNEKVGGDYIHERKEKELKDNMESAEKEENTSVPTDHKESPNNIQQAPVTKPPRLSSSSREPKTYINLAIEPSGVPKMNSGKEPTKDNVKVNSESENVRLSVEKSPNNTELDDAPVKEKTGEQTNPVTDTTTSLPRLASKDKRKAPEPPGTVRSAKNSNAKPPPVTEPKKSSTSEAKKGDGMFVFKPTDYENETPSLPTKRAVPSSSPDIAHRNTAVTKSQHVHDDGEIAKVNKTGRGLTLPRSRKTCCLVM